MRERVAFQEEALPQALADLTRDAQMREAAILSTCNRTEIYGVAETPESAKKWLARHHRIDEAQLSPFLYVLTGREAARHVFRVACGLDSMVLGEAQILGQMKTGARQAESAGTLGVYLHKLFQRAFAVAKAVRSGTAIGANTVSMAAAAVQLSGQIFESIARQRVLFIGAGEMIELCATHFLAQSPCEITVANRTVERGAALAGRLGGKAIRLDELAENLWRHDIIVSCTASPLPIIGLGLVERALKARRHHPLFMVDLAVPRDIEPEVGELDDVFLYTVDDLAQVVTVGMESRQAAVVQAEAIVSAQMEQFMHWLASREAVPLIRGLRDTFERARRHELEHALKRLAAGETAEKALSRLSERLMNKFLHTPTQALQQAGEKDRHALQQAAERLLRIREQESGFGNPKREEVR